MSSKLPSLKNLSRRQRSFCKRIAAGEEAETIIAELFPGQSVGLVFCKMRLNEHIAAFWAAVTATRFSPPALLLNLDQIRNDPKARPADLLGAARLASQLLGYLAAPKQPSKRRSKFSQVVLADEELAAKIAELRRKAQID